LLRENFLMSVMPTMSPEAGRSSSGQETLFADFARFYGLPSAAAIYPPNRWKYLQLWLRDRIGTASSI